MNHRAKRIIIRKIARIKTIGVTKMQGNFVEISFQAKFLRKARNFVEISLHYFCTILQWGRANKLNKYFKLNITLLTIPTGRRQTSWLFTSVAEDLNSGLPRNKTRQWSEWDSNPGPPDCESHTLTTRPRCQRRSGCGAKNSS